MTDARSKVSGREHSKMIEITYQNISDFVSALREYKSVKDRVSDFVEGAREFLRERNLPVCPQMVLSRSDGKWRCYAGQSDSEISGGCDLDQYILKVCELPRDSFEHLAARVIVAALEMQHPERDRAIEGAIQLGRLSILAPVYAKQSQKNYRRGKAPKRRKWAELLAQEIKQWGEIPEDADQPIEIWSTEGEYRIHRDGDEVVCLHNHEKGQTVQKLKKRSFVRGYLNKG